jgi:methionyl-tRNA formyltransferase
VRIAFLGTPPEAALCLHALRDAGHDVALVVTQPDKRRGRGGEAAPSPVKRAAEELGLPVRTPGRAVEVLDDLRGSGATLGVVVAFGQILPRVVLDALPEGFVNVHYSLLPRWRGAAPVERAILAGDERTGVSLMRIEEGLDTGPVYAEAAVVIGPDDTAGHLRAELAEIGARLLVEHLDAIPTMTPSPQEGETTYAEKLTPDEFRLDWSRPAVELARRVRAGNPSPGAWATAGGKRLKVWAAHAADEAEPGVGTPGALVDGPVVSTGDGVLALDRVQVEGRQAVEAAEWIRGFRGDALE